MNSLGAEGTLVVRAEPRALGPLFKVLLGLMVVVGALYLGGLVFSRGGNDPLVTVWLALATQWVPVAIFWLAVASAGSGRLPLALAAAGVTSSAIGDTVYTALMDADGYLAFPSVADPAYLLFYPLMVAALLTLTRSQLAGVERLVVLEVAVATVGASAVLAVVLDPVIRAALEGATAFESAIAVAYPLFDLILVAAIAGIATVPTVRMAGRWWALMTGLGVFAAGDVIYAILTARGDYVAGTPLDATWAVGLAFITWWGVASPRGRVTSSPASARGSAGSVAAVAVLAALAVLVVGAAQPLPVLAIVLAALTVALGAIPLLFRQALLGRLLAAQNEAVRRLTELDQAKTDILVTVNHEFRTPLTSINGNTELLLDGGAGDLPPAAIDMLRTIERSGARLQVLIDETFSASKLQDLEAHSDPTPVAVGGIVARAVARIEPFARRRGITLTLSGEECALLVEADGAHLERALASLVDNGVKFSGPDGEVTITVDGRSDDDVVITISDTGIGIPAADIPRVFTKFFRASNVHGAAIPGVGLGLAIAQQIVHAHGGTISLESTVGVGTSVTVRLPATTSP